jgi:hypothetical protein
MTSKDVSVVFDVKNKIELLLICINIWINNNKHISEGFIYFKSNGNVYFYESNMLIYKNSKWRYGLFSRDGGQLYI